MPDATPRSSRPGAPASPCAPRSISPPSDRAAPTIVAVTGTNGKTTVTTLTAAMLRGRCPRRRGRQHRASRSRRGRGRRRRRRGRGVVVPARVHHDGVPAPRLLRCSTSGADHLDWHRTFEAYTAAKARIFAHQRDADLLVVQPDDPVVAGLAATAPARDGRRSPSPGSGDRLPRADTAAGRLLVAADDESSRRRGLPARGPPDLANALAAIGARAGPRCRRSTRCERRWRVQGLAHRVQPVGRASGVRYVDDSKATNPHATLAARSTASTRGAHRGRSQQGPRSRRASRERSAPAAAVVAIGEAAERGPSGVRRRRAACAHATRCMDEAVRGALSSPSPVTRCCCRRPARRSTGTSNYAHAATTSPRGAVRELVAVDGRPPADPGAGAARLAGRDGRTTGPVPRLLLLATVAVLNVDRRRDGAVGVVGAVARRATARPGTSSSVSCIWTLLGVVGFASRSGSTTASGAAPYEPLLFVQRRGCWCSCYSRGSASTVGGAARWLGFGSWRFQPTEIAKLALRALRRRPADPPRARGRRLAPRAAARCSACSAAFGALVMPRAGPRLRRAARRPDRRRARGRRHPDPASRGRRRRGGGTGHGARDHRAVPARARCSPSSTRPPTPSNTGLPDPAVVHRARQRRRRRRRTRRGPREVALPPERSHRLHLRGDRGGARADRHA